MSRHRRLKRQQDDERRSLTELALDKDPPTMLLHDLLGDVEPEPQPTHFIGRDRALKSPENASLIFRRDPSPMVRHPQLGFRSDKLQRDFDRLATAIIGRIGEDFAQNLLDSKPVPTSHDVVLKAKLQLTSRIP